MKDPTVLLLTSRRRGRPRRATVYTSLSTWLPADQHDAIIRMAQDREMSVSGFVRSVLGGICPPKGCKSENS